MKNHNIGKNIKNRRILAGMTQKELAEALGMGDTGHQVISHIEAGRRGISIARADKLAKILGCRVSEVLCIE